jgi:hypothetical protein
LRFLSKTARFGPLQGLIRTRICRQGEAGCSAERHVRHRPRSTQKSPVWNKKKQTWRPIPFPGFEESTPWILPIPIIAPRARPDKSSLAGEREGEDRSRIDRVPADNRMAEVGLRQPCCKCRRGRLDGLRHHTNDPNRPGPPGSGRLVNARPGPAWPQAPPGLREAGFGPKTATSAHFGGTSAPCSATKSLARRDADPKEKR